MLASLSLFALHQYFSENNMLFDVDLERAAFFVALPFILWVAVLVVDDIYWACAEAALATVNIRPVPAPRPHPGSLDPYPCFI